MFPNSNSVHVVAPPVRLLMVARDTPEILPHFIPSLGPAPPWAAFLEGLTEELEEAAAPSVYDDYRSGFQTQGLGCCHSIVPWRRCLAAAVHQPSVSAAISDQPVCTHKAGWSDSTSRCIAFTDGQ
jgi:hypothetical protein